MEKDVSETSEWNVEGVAPELTLTRRGDPDPRLVALVHILARQAAREWYDQAMKEQRSKRSQNFSAYGPS